MELTAKVQAIVSDDSCWHPKPMYYFIGQELHCSHQVCFFDCLGFNPLGQAFCHCDEVSVLPWGAGQVDNKVQKDELEGVDQLVGM